MALLRQQVLEKIRKFMLLDRNANVDTSAFDFDTDIAKLVIPTHSVSNVTEEAIEKSLEKLKNDSEAASASLNTTKRVRKSLGPSDVTRVWQSVYRDTFNGICAMCDKNKVELTERTTWEVAHIVPFSKGGSDDLSNLRPLCRACNRSMGSKDFKEYVRTWHDDRYHSILERFGLH